MSALLNVITIKITFKLTLAFSEAATINHGNEDKLLLLLMMKARRSKRMIILYWIMLNTR